MNPPEQAVPLVCVPQAIPAAQRAAHFVLAAELLSRPGVQREDLPDGYLFRFPAEAFEGIARFVGNERRCCPALRFEICLSPGGGPIELRLTGPAGVREFLAAELSMAGAARILRESLPAMRWRMAALGGFGAAAAVLGACCVAPALVAVFGASGAGAWALSAGSAPWWLGGAVLASACGLGLIYARRKPCAAAGSPCAAAGAPGLLDAGRAAPRKLRSNRRPGESRGPVP